MKFLHRHLVEAHATTPDRAVAETLAGLDRLHRYLHVHDAPLGHSHSLCPSCNGHLVPSAPGKYLLCTGCLGTRHPRLCYDEDGRRDCVCGLEDLREASRCTP